jgi:hypothetical protein
VLNKTTLENVGKKDNVPFVFGPGWEGEPYQLEDLAEVLNYSQTFTHRS